VCHTSWRGNLPAGGGTVTVTGTHSAHRRPNPHGDSALR
jgi:hypothetical protein